MANGTTAPGLSFPRDTFARLTPAPFLHAHLKQPSSIRPNGRAPHEFRQPNVNTDSLSHSNGSSVVRLGDTAVVCGVRAEILLASDIPHPPRDETPEDELIQELGLLVPNLELSTGCSPNHLPGNPPTALAQALSYRILSLLHDTNLVQLADLRIEHAEPQTEEDGSDDATRIVVKAYWALYIDILCIALDGNAFDAAWTAVLSALSNTRIPKAQWDSDRELIVCSPLISDSTPLQLGSLPIASTFAVFSTSSALKAKEDAEAWVISDPDDFEEKVCRETMTVVVSHGDHGRDLLRVEKHGGAVIDRAKMQECLDIARRKCQAFRTALKAV